MKKRLITVFILLTMVLSCAYIPAGHTGDILIGNYTSQALSNWCWVASAENAVRWEIHGIPDRNQWSTVYHYVNNPYNPYPNITGDIYCSADAAAYMTYYQHIYIAVEAPMSYEFLAEQLYYSHPVICHSGHYQNGVRDYGHAVLVCGWSNGNNQENVIYYDQLTKQYNTCSYTSYCNGSYNGKIYEWTAFHQ
ncbi:MAG: hypothetical protein IKR54_01165 [Lachnospiraceae bacterium]|nr:hypothetical protein [Lachnospiraceae bacterium]